jgi:hypothetical protein
MKKVFLFFAIGLLVATSVFADDLDCGWRKKVIPEALLVGLKNPACVAHDSELDIAIVAGDVYSNQEFSMELRAIAVGYSIEPKIISTIGVDDQKTRTVPSFAFKNSCGLALATARVASSNEAVLIHDLFNTTTALLWNFSKKTVSVITSDFDPKTVYFCNGVESGVYTNFENIAFDRDGRTIALRGTMKGSPTVRAKF